MTEKRTDVPRVELDFPAAVVLEDGAMVHLHGINISPCGMGLGCDPTTAQTLVFHGSLVSPAAGAEFQIQWKLPSLGSEDFVSPCHARARLAWSRPAGPDGHRLGLQFLDVEAESQTNLDRFFRRVMEP